ncbi:hypothetical protein HZA97_01065 [Candidatus Woesearchaeota archaeon]|nr:hypothetical protein [Candidatus Woesearchaeota archaeon]
MKNKILGDKKKSNFDDNLADVVNKLAEEGKLDNSSGVIEKSDYDISNLEFGSQPFAVVWSYNESLKDLRENIARKRWDRHPRPREIFEYLLKNMDNPDIREEVLISYPEWTSCAFKRKGSKLFVALDPENLVFDKSKNAYLVNGSKLICSEKKEFIIGTKPSKVCHHLEELPEELINYLYGPINQYACFKKYTPEISFPNDYQGETINDVWVPIARHKCSLIPVNYAHSRGVKRLLGGGF